MLSKLVSKIDKLNVLYVTCNMTWLEYYTILHVIHVLLSFSWLCDVKHKNTLEKISDCAELTMGNV